MADQQMHLTECQVRWMDMDAYRHVNNTVYLRYLEQARIDLFGPLFGMDGGADAWAPAPDAERTDGFVIAALDATYRRPLTFRPEPVLVQSWITRLGRSSIGIGQRIVDPPASSEAGPSAAGASPLRDAGPYVTATSTLVCIDKGSARSRPLRAHERAWLARFERSDLESNAGAAGRF